MVNLRLRRKKISDLQKDFAAHEKNFSTTTGKLNTDIQALQMTVQAQGEQQQLTQTQATTLVQQVDENNQALTKKMTEFQTAFGQFKENVRQPGNGCFPNPNCYRNHPN